MPPSLHPGYLKGGGVCCGMNSRNVTHNLPNFGVLSSSKFRSSAQSCSEHLLGNVWTSEQYVARCAGLAHHHAGFARVRRHIQSSKPQAPLLSCDTLRSAPHSVVFATPVVATSIILRLHLQQCSNSFAVFLQQSVVSLIQCPGPLDDYLALGEVYWCFAL